MSTRSVRWGGGLLTAALVVSTIPGAGPASGAPVPGPDPAARPGAATPGTVGPDGSVTLITGDRVTVRRGELALIQPALGRSGIPVQVGRADGRLTVLPSDAAALVRAGRLDARLFDVTTLLEFGYDDRRTDLPLIISASGSGGTARSRALAEGARVVRELPAADGVAVSADRQRLPELWRNIVDGATGAAARSTGTKVWLDGLRKPTLEHSVPQIGAPTAWQAGFDGTGITVAVLDTGIDASHPDVAGQVVGRANFTGGVEDDRDRVGHGTHVASTIAGTGAASAGRYRGVAPGARLLDGKVCMEYGCPDSWVIAGMQWAAEQGATVVNLSLGTEDSPGLDPMEQAVRTLTGRFGTLFVISAGNSGRDATVGSPGSADEALTVGAVDRSDELADFSSRGPRSGDGAIKPDITAPGVDIVAANSPDGSMGRPGEPYATSSGTSMSTPHVAGAAAILAQRHPQWSAGTLKSTLMASAVPHPELGAYAQGAGRVDVARAINQTIRTDPPSLSFGRPLWPHDDDVPQTATVTYTNGGAAPVTLALTVESTGPDGRPAPAGMFTLGASTVTVPAAGTAQVSVAADTRVEGADGYYTGRLVGSAAGGALIRTPFALEREVESYDVTVTHLDRTGEVTAVYATSLVGLEAGVVHQGYDPDGTVTIRVPRGRYHLVNQIWEEPADPENPDDRGTSLLTRPGLEVTGPVSLTLDARLAKPVSVTVPRADATAGHASMAVEFIRGDFQAGFETTTFDGFDRLYVGQLGNSGPVEGMAGRLAGQWAKVGADGSTDNSPFVYHLAWFRKGGMFDGFTRVVRPAELATVKARYARHASGPDVVVMGWEFAVLPGVFDLPTPSWLIFATPFERTEYFNTEGGVRWVQHVNESKVDDQGMTESLAFSGGGQTAYRAGTVTRRQWNGGVFGPSLDDPSWPGAWITRTGDEIVASVPMFGDGAGRPGRSVTEAERMTMYRNGVKVGESDVLDAAFEVPSAAADYRIEATAARGAPFSLSTRVDATWTFRSGPATGETPVRLPLSTVRFSPVLDQENRAPAGRLFSVPVSVHRQPGSVGGGTRSLTVDVSYDDGVTWRKAHVLAVGGTGVVLLQHPNRAGFVSLRAAATDRAGNTVRQTVIRAYAITP
ncbi:S8 family serine peptidase [Plantactinospora solaniradicis]|uniref:S8 family serine peptidase n=1 Tax=Plantactinospora solaniradicis TaxID=1723736 RepID=A0ABW1KL28_9ACTN